MPHRIHKWPPGPLPFVIYCGKFLVEPGRPQMTTRCMRIACWIPKAINTHSHYVILIAVPQQ